MQRGPLLNKFLQPMGSPVDKTSNQQNTFVPWQWGVNQGIQTKRIRSSSIYFKRAQTLGLVGTLLGTMQAGTTSSGGYTVINNPANRLQTFDGTNNRIYIGSI